MISRTTTEIIRFFENNICACRYSDFKAEVTQTNKSIEVKVTQMYEYVPVDFQTLNKIGEFFGTDRVNGSTGEYYDGCETCDYGSSYEVTFVIEGD
jgi:hypothetical protein